MNYVWNAASSYGNSFDLLLFLAASAMKATLLLAFVALLCLAIRRLSAATRHLLWTLSLFAALLLPFLSAVEVWEVPVLPAQISSWGSAQSNESARTTDYSFQSTEDGARQGGEASTKMKAGAPKIQDFQPAVNSAERPIPAADFANSDAEPRQRGATVLSTAVNWALAVWLAGALLLLFRLLVGFASSNLLTRGAVEFSNPKLVGLFSSLLTELRVKGNVRLLRSERTLMPIVCGVLRPVVLLPAGADGWSEERMKVVLLHELTHVTRKDCLTQLLAQAACAFYWFNPFVWHAARRLRVEREQACDDYVLRVGTKPSDYAHHLLEIARYLQEHPVFRWSQTTTVAMARQSQLEGRLLAILNKEGKRRAVSQVMTVSVTALMLALFSLLALVRPTIGSAQNPRAPETALNGETAAAEKPASGLFSTTVSALKAQAVIEAEKTLELTNARERDADAKGDSPGKILNGAQDGPSAGQPLQGRPDVEDEVAEIAPPLPGSIPLPVAMPEPALPPAPFVKAKYQREGEPEAQGKSEDFIDEMASVGYTNLSVNELVSLKASGVTAGYVRSLRALGLGSLTPKEVAGMSVNGVTPVFIEAIRNAGYKELTARELTSFRIHGVTPDFIRKLESAGYGGLTAKQLIDFAVHRVTPEFISSMRAAGFGNLSAKELVTLRVHDITPAFVRDARKRLGDLTIKQIVSLKIGGLMEGPGDK
jgi:beta-lactamase regulating signal transducer with metallopeptidase domain